MLGGKKQILILFSMLLLNACSHQPTVGEQMIEHGESTEYIGHQWIDGDNLIKKGKKQSEHGEAMIKKGKKLIEKGKAEIRAGHAKVKKGNNLTHKSEESFHEIVPRS